MSAGSKLFTPFVLRPALKAANRIVVAPMCQYSALNGEASDWHLFHWANLLNSGAGVFIIEATAVNPGARITHKCLGLWDDVTEAAMKDKLNRARSLAPKDVKVLIQLSHAGRKASSALPWEGGGLIDASLQSSSSNSNSTSPSSSDISWRPLAPSPVPLKPIEPPPEELSLDQMNKIKQDFVDTAHRAQRLGIDGVEIHNAHGYLLHEFLSPLSNIRSDKYGGSLENRIRYPLEVFEAVRKSYSGTLGIRVSATDWIENGWNLDETVQFALRLRDIGCDYIHVSSGGLSPDQKIAVKPNYQVPFAKLIKEKSGLPTIAVGMITEASQANDIIEKGDADFVALARAMLYKPRWGWEAAAALKGTVQASSQYWRCLPSGTGPIFESLTFGQR